MIRYLSVIAILINSIVFAQEPATVFTDTVHDNAWVTLSAFDYYSSNRFNNNYMDKWIFGGEITSEIKNKPLSKLKNINAIGAEFENGITGYTPEINVFKVKRFGMMASFSDFHFMTANIPTDLYKIAMYGNASYVGDTMNFSYANLQYQHYQKIGIGFFDEKTMSSVQLSYIAGSKSANFKAANTWMLTPTDMDTVELHTQGSGFRTDRFYPYWAFQGSGFALDLDYNFFFESKKGNRQILNFKVHNLGVIFWNSATALYEVDSSTTYSGFDIKDFINRDTSSTNDFNIADTLGIVQNTGFRSDFLPVEITIQKLADQGSPQKLQAIFGFKAMLNANYFPYFYAGAYYKPKDYMSFSSRVSYGGFGGVKWGLNANFWIRERAYIAVGTFDMLGLISKKIGYGRGLNFTFSFKM